MCVDLDSPYTYSSHHHELSHILSDNVEHLNLGTFPRLSYRCRRNLLANRKPLGLPTMRQAEKAEQSPAHFLDK